MNTHQSYPRSIIVILILLAGFPAFSTDLYLASLPAMSEILQASAFQVQLTLSIFLVGFSLGQLFYGSYSDQYGRKPLLIIGLIFYIIASFVTFLTSSLITLIIARFIQAIGACCGIVMVYAIARDLYSNEHAARLLAMVAMTMNITVSLAPTMGGYLQETWGWRSNFIVLFAMGIITLLFVIVGLPETNKRRSSQPITFRCLIITYLNILKHPLFIRYSIIVASIFSGYFAFIFGSPFLFIGVLGVSPLHYGLLFAIPAIAYILGNFIAARYVTDLGINKLLGIAIMLILIGGLMMFIFSIVFIPNIVLIIASMAMSAIGISIAVPIGIAGALAPFEHQAGSASAMIGFLQFATAGVIGSLISATNIATAIPIAGVISIGGLVSIVAWRSLRFH